MFTLLGLLRTSTAGLGKFGPLNVRRRTQSMSEHVRFDFLFIRSRSQVPHFFSYTSGHMHVIEGEGERERKIIKKKIKMLYGRPNHIWQTQTTDQTRLDT